MRVLIDVANGRVKDELIEVLVRAGHEVERGSATVSAARFDVVVVGSVELAERLHRERPAQAVIMFTRVGDALARIKALEVGASDAVDGSFAYSQVAVRVGAADRRAAMIPQPPERLEIDGCTFDLSAAIATRDGVEVDLTRKELELVRWLPRSELLEHVWQVSPSNETRAVDVAIAGLRAKVERDPAAPAIIVSVRGEGYRWGRALAAVPIEVTTPGGSSSMPLARFGNYAVITDFAREGSEPARRLSSRARTRCAGSVLAATATGPARHAARLE